jgi:hypothetical protein
MSAWVGTGILSDPAEPKHSIVVDTAPHAHASLQLPGYNVNGEGHDGMAAGLQPAPKGYPRLFCWRRVDGVVRDFSHLKHARPVNVRSFDDWVQCFCNLLVHTS